MLSVRQLTLAFSGFEHKVKRWIVKSTGLLFLLLFPGLGAAQTPSVLDVIRTRNLLEQFHRETISALITPPESSVLREIARLKPAAELRILSDRHDPSVLKLGSFWAQVCRAVDPGMCVTGLIQDLKDSDARVKAFACENLAVLKPPSALAPLKAALKDKETVPGYAGHPPVGLFAASALASFGYADGIDLMLAQAERLGNFWHLSYESTFEQLSGRKFPGDLQLWRKWFRDHRKALKYAP